jgi:chromosome segregation protein
MHLKSLTLKGFKSFASATTLRFEPGITCVVGPNGSGKSNVVDALTWVMGEQGAKALRGGKMEDVIFAGTSGRAPLGRAEVTLTIDNSDGALPIDYSEVSITRRMFRDGAGEYEINGSSCRLMDVQELLSDSGIGREMHVIVGQGRLAAILESRPEDRRAFIEEAAGVLKHRKRKEKAVRKLDSMQANLARLTDLTTELRRQLKPLGRQAEVARRAQTVQADLRDARLRIAADDLVTRRTELAEQSHDETKAREEYAAVQDALAEGEAVLAEGEQDLARLTPSAEAAAQTWFQLSALAERVGATVRIATERARHLGDEPEDRRGPDPDELEQRADRVAEEELQLSAPTPLPCAPSPTAGRASRGSPVRWTGCALGPSRTTRRWPVSRPRSRTRGTAATPHRPSSTSSRRRSANSTPVRRDWTRSTRMLSRHWPSPTPASRNCRRENGSRASEWHRCAPGSTLSR